jgi:hypothetical protein
MLRCTSGYLSGTWRVVTGREYTVVDIDPEGLWLRDPSEPIVDAPVAPAKPKRGRPSKTAAAPTVVRPQRNGAHPIHWKGAAWQYDYGHAITCHKLQGSSLAASILLVDGDHKHIMAEWLLVALTRSLTGEVFRYNGTELNDSRHEPYEFFKPHISGHVAADKKKGMVWDDSEYVTADHAVRWFKECRGVCPECKRMMSLQAGDELAASIDNTEPGLPHLAAHCRVICLPCQHGGGAAARKAARGVGAVDDV